MLELQHQSVFLECSHCYNMILCGSSERQSSPLPVDQSWARGLLRLTSRVCQGYRKEYKYQELGRPLGHAGGTLF